MPNKMVQPIHFEDFDGHQFERLVYAYFLRTDNWLSLDWYGQVGRDSGRDIWGIRCRDNYPNGQSICVQCTNRQSLTYAKIESDLENTLKGQNGKPDVFIVITGGKVSAGVRDKLKELFTQKELRETEIWSGNEFEERLRANAESLLLRFVGGEEFPDTAHSLRDFVQETRPQSDEEILALMASIFDRPAFTTPFMQESSIPAFKIAITDTIESLNTGIHRLRDGTEIRRIPSRHALQSQEAKSKLSQIVDMLVQLRAIYDENVKSGNIRSCSCGNVDCSVFFISPKAAREMDTLRVCILDAFRNIYPSFQVKLFRWKRYGDFGCSSLVLE